MSAYYGVPLRHRKMEGWAKLFDLVSEDYRIVGDLVCLTMSGASVLPSARVSIVSEVVWMLEKQGSKVFVVFGKDRCAPSSG